MTSFSLTSGLYGSQALATGDSGIVTRDAVITTVGSFGVYGPGDTIDLRILGQVYSQDYGALCVQGANNRMLLSSTAIIETAALGTDLSPAVEMDEYGTGSFINAGWISGNGAGAFLYTGSVSARINARNIGFILGDDAGLVVRGIGLLVLNNSGSIIGTTDGISAFYSANLDAAALNLTNSGTIEGGRYAIRSGDGADTIINHGTLNGDVLLNGGVDSFDNRGGVVNGTIDLGLGNDFFIPGASEETVQGGLGLDTLNFSGALTGVTLALDDSLANTGWAAGDSYLGFEFVRGSNFGADILIGSAANETLYGLRGADTISGGAGADQVFGGQGIDRLTGGMGNDNFTYNAVSEGGDLITDFANVVGNRDYIRIQASTFGGGLVAGSLAATKFITRADTAAQDADDRFIFNTTDHTLWFDADGNGAAAAILVADLQDTSPMMTSADILLF